MELTHYRASWGWQGWLLARPFPHDGRVMAALRQKQVEARREDSTDPRLAA
jgi:hypothetical protein